MSLEELKCVNTNINLDEYLKYQNEVKRTMANPDWLGDFTKEDLEYLLATGSKIWLFYHNQEFVCSMMAIPSTKDSLNSLTLTEYNPHEVIDYGPMFVNPKYRGHGFQYQMLEYLDNYYKDTKLYAAVTIHPDNTYSINNILKANFMLITTKVFTRGLRNVYLKKLS